MEIKEKDFILKPLSDGNFFMWNLTFYKRVKKRDTGKFELEPGPVLYGLPLEHALQRIIYYRTAEKFKEENIKLFDYIQELNNQYKEIIKLCKGSLPENFDTGD